MTEYAEKIVPLELVCELTLEGQLAGRYRIVENVDVTRDGEPFSNKNRNRDLTPDEGAAIVAGDSAAAMAKVQEAQGRIAELQDQLLSATKTIAKLREALSIYDGAEAAWEEQVRTRVKHLVGG